MAILLAPCEISTDRRKNRNVQWFNNVALLTAIKDNVSLQSDDKYFQAGFWTICHKASFVWKMWHAIWKPVRVGSCCTELYLRAGTKQMRLRFTFVCEQSVSIAASWRQHPQLCKRLHCSRNCRCVLCSVACNWTFLRGHTRDFTQATVSLSVRPMKKNKKPKINRILGTLVGHLSETKSSLSFVARHQECRGCHFDYLREGNFNHATVACLVLILKFRTKRNLEDLPSRMRNNAKSVTWKKRFRDCKNSCFSRRQNVSEFLLNGQHTGNLIWTTNLTWLLSALSICFECCSVTEEIGVSPSGWKLIAVNRHFAKMFWKSLVFM